MRIVLLLVMVFAPLAESAEKNVLECKYGSGFVQHIKFDVDDSSVLLISGDSTRNGSVEVTDTHYSFIIPKTEKTYEARITVNRYSGEATYEFGEPPFGKLNRDNVLHTGICENVSDKPNL